ncbi:transcription factor of the e2f dp family (dimerization partner) [Vairimorpha apis BRL 01]|uniref:Transcription factor of the e2f dp family (Dimerization partner) n=1 Tax=Vairimorpha apis BRL 01 TaxID=1037528 RepID=T0LCG5_9MICR|nr:transcription factor of the e2f dp family (dimerization partner) [Vairimorpha apis BRL 01]
MKILSSDINSESKREGLKYITTMVFEIIKQNEGVTYQYICENISLKNKKTLHRRIYDVLNVMKAEINKLKDMKEILTWLVNKNKNNDNTLKDKLYLPFMIIKTNQNAIIHCNTNEERSIFTFESTAEIELIEDLEILKEIFYAEKNLNNDSKFQNEKNFPFYF